MWHVAPSRATTYCLKSRVLQLQTKKKVRSDNLAVVLSKRVSSNHSFEPKGASDSKIFFFQFFEDSQKPKWLEICLAPDGNFCSKNRCALLAVLAPNPCMYGAVNSQLFCGCRRKSKSQLSGHTFF